jgi:hypothetical protein
LINSAKGVKLLTPLMATSPLGSPGFTGQSMPLFVSLPTWTHSGVTPAAAKALKTELVCIDTACCSWGKV